MVDDDFPALSVSVVNRPDGLRDRIKAAWNILIGKEHETSQIYVHRDEFLEFVNTVVSLVHNPNTR